MKLQIEFSVHGATVGYYTFTASVKGYEINHKHPKFAVDNVGFAKFKAMEYGKLAALLVEHVASL